MKARIAAGIAVLVALSIVPASTALGAVSGPVKGGGPATSSLPISTEVGVAQLEVEGGATGDGPADDAECQSYAAEIEGYYNDGIVYYGDYAAGGKENGSYLDSALFNFGQAHEAEAEGAGRGCFFIF